jgi:hypothetical protein
MTYRLGGDRSIQLSYNPKRKCTFTSCSDIIAIGIQKNNKTLEVFATRAVSGKDF